jgi:hypothetical protein
VRVLLVTLERSLSLSHFIIVLGILSDFRSACPGRPISGT